MIEELIDIIKENAHKLRNCDSAFQYSSLLRSITENYKPPGMDDLVFKDIVLALTNIYVWGEDEKR